MAAKKGGKKGKKSGKKAAPVEAEAVAAAPAARATAVKTPVAEAPAPAPAGAATSSSGSLVVTSKLREALRGHEVRMSGDLPEALNAEVLAMLERAVERARENRRGTVRPSDL